jgi:endonuclease YncB( thermonuclease family)
MRSPLCAFVFLLALAFCLPLRAEELRGRIVGVTDGDTLKLLDANRQEHVIRVSGIDAPERGQPYGQKAKERLSQLTYHQSVSAHCHKKDRYGRSVCTIVNGAGADVGLTLVKDGMAWHFKRYEREQNAEEAAAYTAAESFARGARAGLWRDPHPVAPWDWRAGAR